MSTQRKRRLFLQRSARILLTCGVCGVSGCINVDVGTEKPIKLDPVKVDLDMRVDIYQYDSNSEEARTTARNREDAAKRLRDRMAEVQELKNNRFVGENHLGLLTIRNLPAGDYGDYVRKTVDEENADRTYMMTDKSNQEGISLAAVQREQWLRRSQASFTGEWIEQSGPDDGTFIWEQKP